MSYLKKSKPTCGRPVERPCKTDDTNVEDEAFTSIEDQIDNLRVKVSLQERYNKALNEEVNETNEGASDMISQLTRENIQLRQDLMQEKRAEKRACLHALRSYPLFQLSICEKDARGVIHWLDDKIFDLAKSLNAIILALREMHLKLQNAEAHVHHLEQYPVPGSELWERRAENERVRLECAIEARKANKEAAIIVNKKYQGILDVLKSEQAKWPYAMLTMEKHHKQAWAELLSLQAMLEDAVRLRDEASARQALTEAEFLANRKQRRSQLTKMKKCLVFSLEKNTRVQIQNQSSVKMLMPGYTSMLKLTESRKIMQDIIHKQQEIEEYRDMVKQLLEAMRVSDLRKCPERLESLKQVSENLENEISIKQHLREILIKHKNRIELILYYFRYTGETKEQEFNELLEEKKAFLEEVEAEITLRTFEKNFDGNIVLQLRTAMIGLEARFQKPIRRGEPHVKIDRLPTMMARIRRDVKNLVDTVDSLNSQFPVGSMPKKPYQDYIKYTILSRYTRIGAPEELDKFDDGDSSDPDLEIDSSVPSRKEIKMNSNRFYINAMRQKSTMNTNAR